MTPRRIALYGTGRAGCAVAAAARHAGLSIATAWNRGAPRAAQVASTLRLEIQSGTPPPPAGDVDLALIAVTDRAIPEVAAALAAAHCVSPPTVAAHLAGALGLEPLAAIAALGCPTGSIHPARSLVGPESSVEGAFCAIDGDPAALSVLRAFAEALGCHHAVITGERRGLYHAATALAANDVTALVDRSASLLATVGVPPEDALRTALDLARGALDNTARMGTAAALTGPVSRGDAAVVARHLAALGAAAPEVAEAHRHLSLALLEVAREQIPPDRLRQLVQILDPQGVGTTRS